MTVSSAAELDGALGKMRSMLGADGYELVTEMADERVSLTVVATPDACAECLVPKDLFKTITLDALKVAGIALDAENLVIAYPTDSKDVS